MTDPKTISCQFNPPKTSINIGERFDMNCVLPEGLKLTSSVKLIWPDPQFQYSLYFLGMKPQEMGNAIFEFTAYKPGQYENVSFQIQDGQTVLTSNPLNWTVASVRTQEDKEPFASYGPFQFGYPLWFWLTLFGVILSIVGAISFFLYRTSKRRRLLASLEQYKTMLTPFNQFSKDMRSIFKQVQSGQIQTAAPEVFHRIDEDFRLYLVRELRVPAMIYSRRQILSEIKKYHRSIYTEIEPELKKLLNELEKGREQKNRVGARDCEQMYLLSRKVGEKIHSLTRGRP